MRALLTVALLFPPLAARAAVDDPDTIDAMQARAGKPYVYLMIVQDRDWSPETHVMIGNKISGYMRYALGGQLVRDTPEASGMRVRIVLVSEAPPAPRDVEMLSLMRAQATAAGFDMVWGGADDLLKMVDEE